jgi:thioredoxin-dependent peroxiredoxin
MVAIGSAAPDFELVGANKKPFKLSDYLGKLVVLAFYRGDDTPTCNRQLTEYNAIYDECKELNAEMLGISPDDPTTHYSFGCRLDLSFPLLSDTNRTVGREYGVTNAIVGYGRATFVIDPTGTLRAEHRPVLAGLLTYPAARDVMESVRSAL